MKQGGGAVLMEIIPGRVLARILGCIGNVTCSVVTNLRYHSVSIHSRVDYGVVTVVTVITGQFWVGIDNAEEFPLAKWSETVQDLPKEQVAVLQDQLVDKVIAVINPGFGTSEEEWSQAGFF